MHKIGIHVGEASRTAHHISEEIGIQDHEKDEHTLAPIQKKLKSNVDNDEILSIYFLYYVVYSLIMSI